MTVAVALALLPIFVLVLLSIPGFIPWLLGWYSDRLWRRLRADGVARKCPVCRVEFIRHTEPKDACPRCGAHTEGVSA